MLLESFPYILSLLALSLFYYLLSSAKQQNYFLLALSLSFYIYLTHIWSLILIITIIVTALAIKMRNKKVSYLAIGFILAQFIFLKKYIPDFSVLSTESLLFPIGLSFFTFQAISLIIDNSNSKNSLKTSDIFLFLSYFPQLTAGPIEKGSELIPQIQQRREITKSTFEESFIKIGSGFLKKIIVANVIAEILFKFKAAPSISVVELLLLPILCRYFIFSNFSAYTDIALGTSRLFGIKLIENFNRPLQSKNLTEFWQRWHISLSRWVKSYIYFPVAINLLRRKLPVLLATFISFVLIGLWHGFTFQFFLYGLIQAFFISLETKFPSLVFEKGQSFTKRFIGGSLYRYLVFMVPSILFFFTFTDLTKIELGNSHVDIRALGTPLLVIILWELTSHITKTWQQDVSVYFNQVSFPLRLLIYLAGFSIFMLLGRHSVSTSFLYFYF